MSDEIICDTFMIDELFSTHFLYNGLIEIAIKISTTTNDDYNDL